MELDFQEGQDMKSFLVHNRDQFEEYLLEEAVNVRDKINEIHRIGNINLINNAHKLVLYIVEEQHEEVVAFARQEGIAWARHSLTVAFKLEWVNAIRRTLWFFLYQYDQKHNKEATMDHFYTQEKQINDQMDEFLNTFFISYSKYKDELIEKHKRLVEKLSVPLIPITSTISVLPLIGTIDYNRASIIEEQVLLEIGKVRIGTLIMDFSGVVDMEEDTINQILKVMDGVKMMGCKPLLTGIRPELVRKFMNFGKLDVETKATLQQTLSEYMSEFSQ